jgi:hypothetical protein
MFERPELPKRGLQNRSKKKTLLNPNRRIKKEEKGECLANEGRDAK